MYMCGLILLDMYGVVIRTTVACKADLRVFLNKKAPEKIIRDSYAYKMLLGSYSMKMPKPNELIQLNKNKFCLFSPYTLREYAKLCVQKCKFAKDCLLCLNIRWGFFPKRIPQTGKGHLAFEPHRYIPGTGSPLACLSSVSLIWGCLYNSPDKLD